MIAVEIARLVEMMLVEIEHDKAASLAQQVRSGGERSLRIHRVMQRLAEDDEIDAARRDGRLGQVAQAELEIGDALLLGLGATKRDHLGGVVHGDDFFRAPREQLGEPALAGAQVSHNDSGHKLRKERADFRPGASWTKTFSQAAGDAVEVIARGGTAFLQHEFQSGRVGLSCGHFAQGGPGRLEDMARVGAHFGDERVVGALAFAARFNQLHAAQVG